jgi:hypothetical protein
LAVQILSGKHAALKKLLLRHKVSLAAQVDEQAEKIKTKKNLSPQRTERKNNK